MAPRHTFLINFLFSIVTQVKLRFSDTAFIIHQQWLKGNDKITFPTVHNYVYNRNKFLRIDEIDRQHSVQLEHDLLEERKRDAAAAAAASATKSEPQARKIKRRKSRSLDRKRNRQENVVVSAAAASTSDNSAEASEKENEIQLEYVDCVDHQQRSSEEFDRTVIAEAPRNVTDAEVHQSPTSNVKKGDDDDGNDRTEQVDINHNNSEVNKNDCVLLSVPIHRKVFSPISDSSSWDESDDNVGNYAAVELRNKVNHFERFICRK